MVVYFNVAASDEFAAKVDKAIERDQHCENRSQYIRAALREKMHRDGM